ncbi:MAG: hypothetical protein ACLP29_06825 [Dissulfurispiraceae bacterium]|jgi:hypothetical protein
MLRQAANRTRGCTWTGAPWLRSSSTHHQSIEEMKAKAHMGERERRLYIIRNSLLEQEWVQVDRRTLSIAARAISSMIQTQGIGDLYRICVTAQRDGID